MKKILLITDIPPCRNFTAGLVLHRLCTFLPKDSIACFAVVNPHINAVVDPELSWMPVRYATKPSEVKSKNLPGLLGELQQFIAERHTEKVEVKQIVEQAVAFAKEVGAERIWCVLQGQTMFRVANGVADQTGLPLLTQVWDPPEWWVRAHHVDRWSTRNILSQFDKALKRSEICAAASWAMAEQYVNEYGIKSEPVIPGVDSSWIQPPAQHPNECDTVAIGMAGQLYSQAEWEALLATLDMMKWKLGGKKVVVRFLGRQFTAQSRADVNIEYLGWMGQKETIKALSECDMLYCPYWFDPTFEKEARQSFPSKLTTYLAAGRPVIFHGPEYASPARFLKSYNAALFCFNLDKEAIYSSIHRLWLDVELYKRIARNGSQALQENLTFATMRKQFYKFLAEPDLGADESTESFDFAPPAAQEYPSVEAPLTVVNRLYSGLTLG